MALSATDEYIAATAFNLMDGPTADFDRSSSFCHPRTTRHAMPRLSSEESLCHEPLTDFSRFQGVVVRGGLASIGRAMIAATVAISSSAYAAETRPRNHRTNAIYEASHTVRLLQVKAALSRLETLAAKPDGWKGPD